MIKHKLKKTNQVSMNRVNGALEETHMVYRLLNSGFCNTWGGGGGGGGCIGTSSGPCWNCAQGAGAPGRHLGIQDGRQYTSGRHLGLDGGRKCTGGHLGFQDGGQGHLAPWAQFQQSYFFFIPYLFSSLKLHVTISPGQPPERPGFQQMVGCG